MKTDPNDLIDSWNNEVSVSHGLTKREYFAAMAMQGLLSAVYSSKEMLNEFTTEEDNFRRHLTGCEAISRCATNYADALIERLNK